MGSEQAVAITALVLVGAGLLWIMTFRLFWLAVFGIAGLASLFAMLASIIHFQILGALLFFAGWFLSWAIVGFIAQMD